MPKNIITESRKDQTTVTGFKIPTPSAPCRRPSFFAEYLGLRVAPRGDDTRNNISNAGAARAALADAIAIRGGSRTARASKATAL